MKEKGLIQEKYILQHIIKNKLFNYDGYIFNDGDIKNIYIIIRDYYNEYLSIPNNTTLKELCDENLLKLVPSYLNYKEYDTLEPEWFIKHFEEFINSRIADKEITRIIDDKRSGKIDVVLKKLNKDISIDDESNEEDVDDFRDTPYIEDSVYENLPSLIKKMISYYDVKRKKDVFLTSFITIMSSVLNDAYMIYNGGRVYPNLYSFIVAPPASGKGVIVDPLKTLKLYDEQLKQEYLDKFKMAPENEKDEIMREYSTIPGNSSHAALIQQLENQNGKGLIFQTEADTLVDATKKEWGDYSENLRSAFHHEKISLNRKKTKENKIPRVDIDYPKLSVCISGTPNQVVSLIKSTANGLFSRFLFYCFKTEIKWDRTILSDFDTDKVFGQKFSNEILDIINFYKGKEIKIKFTEEQSEKFHNEMENMLSNSTTFNGDYIKDTIFRNGLRVVRIAMILTLFYKYQELFKNIKDEMYCDDTALDIAISLIKTYHKHNEFIFNNLTNQDENITFRKNNIEELFTLMDDEFKGYEIVKKGEKMNINERQVKYLIKKLKDNNKIIKIDKYTYKKV